MTQLTPVRMFAGPRTGQNAKALYREIAAGRLRAMRVGRRYFTCDQWVDEWIEASMVAGPVAPVRAPKRTRRAANENATSTATPATQAG